ncbi:peptidase M48-like protein [Loktanella sp. PT4BL]|jgi:predicted Zn-dependent protease|uniref:M48 family metallopeptidase n=1 Tax=Loktanella sp. PT4BL TaxID=2135611 RepID=UPI000D767E95|nr:M48 family metallopeptidase [Loktanella sp. PT4BL]PXW72783.1 peptidase M48-like protein [Loktanella sp. PT4BL]
MIRFLPLLLCAVISACSPVVVEAPTPQPVMQAAAPVSPRLSQRQAVDNFEFVVRRVKPVAEQFCRSSRQQSNCDFQIVIDTRSERGVNAFQTLDRAGRPVIGFTVPLIAEARNRDELAFVMAHEAAHHILGHIGRQQQNAAMGGLLVGALAGALGAADIESAQRIGATVGARTYSKEFELEADALGTRIAAAAGFDPLRGAEFFFRIPDPGDRFLGTHPPNADRVRTVQRVAAGL